MPRHPSEKSLQRLTLRQVARAIGRTEVKTLRLINRLGFLEVAHRKNGRYDSALVKALLQMLDTASPAEEADWLTRFTQGDTHG